MGDRSLQVLEHYTSVQGEGLRTGQLTQFVRFAGCNLRCPGWPCDTQHAIEPKLYIGKYHRAKEEMLEAMIREEFNQHGAMNVCFTGGEPLMQPLDTLYPAMRLLDNDFDFEFFTNGTFEIPNWIYANHQIMMDWKLPGSGEFFDDKTQAIRMMNAKNLMSWHGIKFVCKHEDDLGHAVRWGEILREAGVVAKFWLGSAFGEISEADVVNFMMEHKLTDWNLNVQVHKYVWDPEKTLV